MLRAGGNAADACVAAVAALNCTEPCMTGIGGDAFCLFYDAHTKRVHGLNGSGASPAALSLELGKKQGGPGGSPLAASAEVMDPSSVHCVTVPGAAATWADTVSLFGRLPLAEVLRPAIELAEEGFPVNVISAQLWAEQTDQLTTRWGGLKGNPGAAALLRPDGRPPAAGEWMRMPELASTFRALASDGKDGFYTGRIARAIVECVRAHGGVLAESDLAAHTTRRVEPISAPFAGHTVHQIPPNGSGLVSLLALRILDALGPPDDERAELGGHGTSGDCSPASAALLHRVIEALRLAFADGAACIADPAADVDNSVPRSGVAVGTMGAGAPVTVDDSEQETAARRQWEWLLSDEYTRSRAALVRDATAMDAAVAGDDSPGALAAFAASRSETVYLTAVDSDGNGCSFICSNYMGFGSGLVPRGCGFSLQNRGANFVLSPDAHPNLLGPNRRPYHTIIPAMVTDAHGDLAASFGVMGGFMQPQGQVQVLINWLWRGMHPQAALDAPRIILEPAAPPPACLQLPSTRAREGIVVFAEEGVPAGTIQHLRRLGHHVDPAPVCGADRKLFGRGQFIAVKREGARRKRTRDQVGDGERAAKMPAAASPLRSRAPQQVLWAGSDPRGDGSAMGW